MIRARLTRPLAPAFTALSALVGASLRQDYPLDSVHAALSQVDDWSIFLAGARRHRVVGMITPILTTALSTSSVPADVVETLRKMQRHQNLHGLSQLAEIRRLQQAFDAVGIPFVILKGIPLSQHLYGAPFIRGIGDIDILVSPERIMPAFDLLQTLDYSTPHEKWLHKTVLQGGSARDITFHHPNGHIVEAHFQLWDSNTRQKNSQDTSWRQSSTTIIEGLSVPVLDKDILATYLIHHGSRHCWDRLSWLADIALALTPPALRRDALSHCAERSLSRHAQHALWLLRDRFGLEFPEATLPPTSPKARWFIRAFYSDDRWLKRPERGTAAWMSREIQQRCWRLLMLPEWRQWVRTIRAAWVYPVDLETLHLPPRLFWLYPALRPLGWFIRNFIRRK